KSFDPVKGRFHTIKLSFNNLKLGSEVGIFCVESFIFDALRQETEVIEKHRRDNDHSKGPKAGSKLKMAGRNHHLTDLTCTVGYHHEGDKLVFQRLFTFFVQS